MAVRKPWKARYFTASPWVGVPVFVEMADLLAVEVGEEHAGEFLLHFAGAILNGPVPSCSRPVVVNRFSSDNCRAERVLLVLGIAGEEACGKVGVARFPGFFV
jgi:hypothetical protein